MPHVREPQTLVVSDVDPVAMRGGDQLQRRSEALVGVGDGALGDAQRELRSRVRRSFHYRRGCDQALSRLVDASCGDEVMDEAGEVSGTKDIGYVRQRERASSGNVSNLRGDREHASDAEPDLGLLLSRQRLVQSGVGEVNRN